MNSANLMKLLRSWKWISVFILVAIGLDQWTKVEAQRKLMVWSHETDIALYQGSRLPLITIGQNDIQANPSPYFIFSLNYVRNPGAAWGTFSHLPNSQRKIFFNAVTVLAVGVIVWFLWITPWAHHWARVGLYLVLSGAVGNFIDRTRLGFVIDWIDLRWRFSGWRYTFPSFNIADICISIGVVMLIYDMVVKEPRRKKLAADMMLSQSVSEYKDDTETT